MRKDLRKLVKAIEAAGYQVIVDSKGHVRVYTADGDYVTTFSGTPSDKRSDANSLRPLKRRGFRWPPGR